MGHHLSRDIRKKTYNNNGIDNVKRKELIRYLDEMDKQLKFLTNELHIEVDTKHKNHKIISYKYNTFDKDL
jgi:hypothetical protein